jgi:hypothetical protein
MPVVFVKAITTDGGSRSTAGAAALGARLLLAAAAVLAFAPPLAAESGGDILAPAAGAVVRAGDVVEVRWTPVPPDVEEFELLLSVDGGKSFPLRLTEMLDPRLTSYSWRVPNVPTGAARIVLRVGEDDREAMLRPGPAFEVLGDAEAPPGKFTFRGGEWWTTEGIAVEPREVEIEPSWSDQEPRRDRSAAAVGFPPPRPDVGTLQTAASVGHGDALSKRSSPAVHPRQDGAATSFPKRE